MAQSIASALSGYLAACPPFDWQRMNCAQFVATWVYQRERVELFVPGVAGKLESRRVLARLGGTLRAAVTAELAREPVPAAMARPGDVVLVERDGGQTLGICAGRTAAVLTTAGVVHIPMQEVSAAWHIEAAACASA